MQESILKSDKRAQPFLKWVGGKRQLLPTLVELFQQSKAPGRYHEPFLGGGAMYFGLFSSGLLTRKKSCLSDSNASLVETYLGVQEDVESVIKKLREHAAKHSEKYYYEVRESRPTSRSGKAARVIYLNKTCYNGLYRENSRGEFNTPFGRYVNPRICDEPTLRVASEALHRATISQSTFEETLGNVETDDFVYFDPPYDPISSTASFTSYAKGGFDTKKQEKLADVFTELASRGVKVLLSNSDTPYVRRLYKDFNVSVILATRNVNSRGDRRGKINELLVSSF